jgi:hypothetical protein
MKSGGKVVGGQVDLCDAAQREEHAKEESGWLHSGGVSCKIGFFVLLFLVNLWE